MVFPEAFRQYAQAEQAEDLLTVRLRQLDAHRQPGNGLDRDAFVIGAKLRHAFGHEFIEGKGHVGGGDRAAVLEAGAGVDIQFHPAHVGRETGRFGNQRVIAAGFVVGVGEQRIVQLHRALAGYAAGSEAVEVVVGADGRQSHVTSLGRRRVDVVEMAEVGGVFRFTEKGESVAFVEGFGPQTEAQCREHQSSENAHGHQTVSSCCGIKYNLRPA